MNETQGERGEITVMTGKMQMSQDRTDGLRQVLRCFKNEASLRKWCNAYKFMITLNGEKSQFSRNEVKSVLLSSPEDLKSPLLIHYLGRMAVSDM